MPIVISNDSKLLNLRGEQSIMNDTFCQDYLFAVSDL